MQASKPDKLIISKRKISVRTELSLYFAVAGLLTISVISIIVNFFLEEQFKAYAIKKQQHRNLEVVALISNQYSGEGNWNYDLIQSIGVNLLEEGLILKITDKQKHVIWSSLEYNNGICQTMIHHMTERMSHKYPSVKGGFTEQSYPLLSGGETVGSLELGYYGPFYFTDTEFYFIDTLNRILFVSALGTLVLAIIFGLFFSNKLTRPLTEVVKTASALANGDYRSNRQVSASNKEVQTLIQAINTLSATLQKQENLRKQLTADVAHELRTPLTTLQGHIEAMLDGVWDISQHRLENCHEEVVRMRQLVKSLETLALYDAACMQLEKSRFSCKELVEHVFYLYESRFKRKQIVFSYEAEDVMLTADKTKLIQVLSNLLTNSCDYCPPGCTVKIKAGKKHELLLLSVSDNGPGIPNADLPHIFERFYRVEKSRNRKTGGSGIGLSIVKEIITAHEGKIEVFSSQQANQETKSHGTEFIISLPV